MRVAFIGLGNMGGPMALHLLKAGYEVVGVDLSEQVRQRCRAAGMTIADTVIDAARGAQVVVSMLPESHDVESLYLGGRHGAGLLEELSRDALVIDCSTISATSARKVSDVAKKRQLGCIDAPVSGGAVGAEAGTLTFMVGGSALDLQRARPILEAMGKNIFHAGDSGAGQTAKICNNMLLGILMIGTSEALALGAANGLDPKVLSEIMRRSSGGNWVLETYNPVPGVMENAPASKGYASSFRTDLMLKDLSLAQESATAVKAVTPLGGIARNLYAAHSLGGNGALDYSSVIRLLQGRPRE